MKTRSLIFALAAGGSVLFSGCSQGLQVSVEDATEVALDDSNNLQDNVTNLEAKEDGNKYKVSFTVDSGTYQYTINKDGIIEDCDYEKNNGEAAGQEQKSETSKEKKQESESAPEGMISKEDAVTAALNNAGLSKEDVTNLDAKLNSAKTEYTVEFDFGDSRNQVTVDAASGEVLSSVFI